MLKQIIAAMLVIALLSVPCVSQGHSIEESLFSNPLENIKRKNKDDAIRDAKAKSAQKENSPLANRATGFSLFFRLIGEHPTAERLESDKYRLSIIGIESLSEQNRIIQTAEEFVAMSNSNKFEAEQTIVKKHHTNGDKNHTPFTEDDWKATRKIQKDKAKELKKIIKSLERSISRASFEAIENFIYNVINPSTKFHLTSNGEVEVERLRREGKKSVSLETECAGGNECYPPNGDIYNGYTYTDIWHSVTSPGNPEWESPDGLVMDGTFNFVSESVYEVDPVSNSHGINFVSEVRDFESGSSVSNLAHYIIWTNNNGDTGGQQTYYSLESFLSTENGGFDKRILYDVWCGSGYSNTQSTNYYFGTSNLIFYYRYQDAVSGLYYFWHDAHESTGGLCDTMCGNWIDRRTAGEVSLQWKLGSATYQNMSGSTALVVVPWGSRDKIYKLPWHENSINKWCSTIAGGASAKWFSQDLNPFSICFDKSVNVGWIWN